MPSGFLVANHGKGFRAVRELQRADLWEAACYFAYPPTSTPGIYTHYRGLFLSSTPLSGSGEHVKEFPVPAAELAIRGQRLCYYPARQFGRLFFRRVALCRHRSLRRSSHCNFRQLPGIVTLPRAHTRRGAARSRARLLPSGAYSPTRRTLCKSARAVRPASTAWMGRAPD